MAIQGRSGEVKWGDLVAPAEGEVREAVGEDHGAAARSWGRWVGVEVAIEMAIDVGGAELDSWAAVCSNPVDSVLMRGCRELVIGTERSLFAKETVSVHVSAEAKRIQSEMWKLSGGLCRSRFIYARRGVQNGGPNFS